MFQFEKMCESPFPNKNNNKNTIIEFGHVF